MKLLHYILSFFYLTPQNRHELVTKNIGYFHHIFNKRFSNIFFMDKDDLRQECYYGFIKAADNYDPSYNVSFLVYSRYYIHGYGINAIKKHNKTKINSVNFKENLINHNKNFYRNDILGLGYEKVHAIENFIEYCNESEYGYLLREYYINNLSYRKISVKYNIVRSTLTSTIKSEMSLFKIKYGYGKNI